ncbi:MAG: hypothetical protein OFPI_35800 [Osedax symbiont Rs2]|nr:MAG: hypothetical protein OFPI_35800 [Osedax symbiont Rs2]
MYHSPIYRAFLILFGACIVGAASLSHKKILSGKCIGEL